MARAVEISSVDESVQIKSDSSIAGYQFQVEGMLVLGAYGGQTQASQFAPATDVDTVVALSYTGGVLPPTATPKVLLNLDGLIEGDVCLSDVLVGTSSGVELSYELQCVGAGQVPSLAGCTDPAAANYDPVASVNDGGCLYDVVWETDVCLTVGESDFTTVEVLYESGVPVGGFSFQVLGMLLTDVQGGATNATGFTMTITDQGLQGSMTLVPLPLSAEPVPLLELSGPISADICLSDLQFVDSIGGDLTSTFVCP